MWLGVSPTSSASAVWLPAIAAAFSIVFFNDIRHSIGLDLNCPHVAKIWAIVTTYGQIPYVDIFPPHEGTHAILFSHPCHHNGQFGWCLGRADRAGVHPSARCGDLRCRSYASNRDACTPRVFGTATGPQPFLPHRLRFVFGFSEQAIRRQVACIGLCAHTGACSASVPPRTVLWSAWSGAEERCSRPLAFVRLEHFSRCGTGRSICRCPVLASRQFPPRLHMARSNIQSCPCWCICRPVLHVRRRICRTKQRSLLSAHRRFLASSFALSSCCFGYPVCCCLPPCDPSSM